jgi:hypothetical protein
MRMVRISGVIKDVSRGGPAADPLVAEGTEILDQLRDSLQKQEDKADGHEYFIGIDGRSPG